MSDFKSTGIIQANSFNDILQLSDGSKWIQLVCHNVNKGSNMFSSSDNKLSYVYHNSECWCDFSLISTCTRPASGYEILVLQQNSGSEAITQYRWLQTVNPLTATWADVNPSSGNITHYDSATYGGMYILNSTVWMCFANGSNGNWYGCAHHTLWGGTAGTSGYIPGYNGNQVTGWQNVYLRVTDSPLKVYNNIIMANDIIEN